MKHVHTHYDNLHIARNAPPEAIRAAYRALSRQHHPDRNRDDPEATRVMALINASYAVLSHPARRREHDAWIARAESPDAALHPLPAPAAQAAALPLFYRLSPAQVRLWFYPLGFTVLLAGFWLGARAIEFVAGRFGQGSSAPYQTSLPVPAPVPRLPPAAVPPPAASGHVRPATAPNGARWPAMPGHVPGYQRLNTNGRSNITIDNSQGESDLFVKLVVLDVPARSVRHVYVPAYSQFRIEKIRPGVYDIRYRDLSRGGQFRSEPMVLVEVMTDDGMRATDVIIAPDRTEDGGAEIYPIADSDF